MASIFTILAVIGVAILIGEVSIGEKHYGIILSSGAWRVVVKLLGTLFAIVGLVGALVAAVSQRSFPPSSTRLKVEAVPAASFFTTVEERSITTTFGDMVNDAQRLDLLATTAVNLLSSYQRELDVLLRRGCKIRMMFLDPKSEASKIAYGGQQEKYRQNIERALGVMRELKQRGDMEIKSLQHAPTTSMIFVYKRSGDESFVQVQLYFLRAAIGADRPVFCVTECDRWFQIFQREYDDLWRSGSDHNAEPRAGCS